MRDLNYDGLQTLLDIVHKAAAAGPAYQWIVDAANAEIMDMKPKPPAPEPTVKPDPINPPDEPWPAEPAPNAPITARFPETSPETTNENG